MKLPFALVGGSALFLAIGTLSVVACSSSDDDDDGTSTSSKKDAGADSGDDGDDGDDDASVTHGADAGAGDSGTGTDGGSSDASPGMDAGNGHDSGPDSGEQEDSGPTDGGSDAADAADGSVSGFVDIYGCGTPHDCTAGQNCYLNAYPGWDGGDFPAPTGCKLEGAIGSVCKPAASALASDVEVCAELRDGGHTPCPTGTTCQTMTVYSKEFGACLPGNFDAGCGTTKFIPYADAPNFCFNDATNEVDGGCVSPSVVCCDKYVDKTYAPACLATVADCHL